MPEQRRTHLVPSEELFRALVQNSSAVISLLDAHGVVVYQSPSIERLLGYRPQDRIGAASQGWRRVVHIPALPPYQQKISFVNVLACITRPLLLTLAAPLPD